MFLENLRNFFNFEVFLGLRCTAPSDPSLSLHPPTQHPTTYQFFHGSNLSRKQNMFAREMLCRDPVANFWLLPQAGGKTTVIG